MDQLETENDSHINPTDNNIFVGTIAQILNNGDRNQILLETSGLRNPDLILWLTEMIKVGDATVIRLLCDNYSAGDIKDVLDTIRVSRQLLCMLIEIANLKPLPVVENNEPEGSIETP